ncbi:MAG: hypothetical protein LC749_12260 [Actinobacteria bacterium]|nr:hypothetical protein [Actinomycetota bacterium]
MKTGGLPRPQSADGQETTLKRLQHEFPTDADLILLCSFRADLDGEQTIDQLRKGLLAAGFRALHAHHVIRSSEILQRVSRNRYRLRGYHP